MTPDDYNATQISQGQLTIAHITKLVRAWQASHGLEVDGMAGPKTIATLENWGAVPLLRSPMPVLPDGRRAEITSGFRPADRPDHNGVDLFFKWKPGDHPDFVGDRGSEGRNSDGTPRWVVPTGVIAIAAADGVVTLAGDSPTGHRVWIDVGQGWRIGYFHLLDTRVKVGQHVEAGAEIGLVGDNPSDTDGRHLHFELSPTDRYEPHNPEPHITL